MAEMDEGFDGLLGMIDSKLMDVFTCLQGTIVSYADGLAVVQPKGLRRYADGDTLPFPPVHGARVCWPSFAGGTAGVKGPVRQGDPCLLIFAQVAIDGTDDRRTHDLTDCHAVMGSLGNVVGQSSDNSSMTMFFGDSFFRIDESGNASINCANMSINASGKFDVSAPSGSTIDSEITTMTGITVSEGPLTGQSGMAVTGMHPEGGAGGSSVSGTLTVEDDVIAGGISTKTHIHIDSQGKPTSEPEKE